MFPTAFHSAIIKLLALIFGFSTYGGKIAITAPINHSQAEKGMYFSCVLFFVCLLFDQGVKYFPETTELISTEVSLTKIGPNCPRPSCQRCTKENI